MQQSDIRILSDHHQVEKGLDKVTILNTGRIGIYKGTYTPLLPPCRKTPVSLLSPLIAFLASYCVTFLRIPLYLKGLRLSLVDYEPLGLIRASCMAFSPFTCISKSWGVSCGNWHCRLAFIMDHCIIIHRVHPCHKLTATPQSRSHTSESTIFPESLTGCPSISP
jgi:hypothetical protein